MSFFGIIFGTGIVLALISSFKKSMLKMFILRDELKAKLETDDAETKAITEMKYRYVNMWCEAITLLGGLSAVSLAKDMHDELHNKK